MAFDEAVTQGGEAAAGDAVIFSSMDDLSLGRDLFMGSGTEVGHTNVLPETPTSHGYNESANEDVKSSVGEKRLQP